MKRWSWFSGGIVLGLLLAVAFGFSQSGQFDAASLKRTATFSGQPVRPTTTASWA
jgi:hypothetical protein